MFGIDGLFFCKWKDNPCLLNIILLKVFQGMINCLYNSRLGMYYKYCKRISLLINEVDLAVVISSINYK